MKAWTRNLKPAPCEGLPSATVATRLLELGTEDPDCFTVVHMDRVMKPEKGDRMPNTDGSSFWKEKPTQLNPSLPGSSVYRIKRTIFLCIATSARLRHPCAPSCADPMSIGLLFSIQFPLPFCFLEVRCSTLEVVNFDLRGWLGWELKGSAVEPKSVVSTLWF